MIEPERGERNEREERQVLLRVRGQVRLVRELSEKLTGNAGGDAECGTSWTECRTAEAG